MVTIGLWILGVLGYFIGSLAACAFFTFVGGKQRYNALSFYGSYPAPVLGTIFWPITAVVALIYFLYTYILSLPFKYIYNNLPSIQDLEERKQARLKRQEEMKSKNFLKIQ